LQPILPSFLHPSPPYHPPISVLSTRLLLSAARSLRRHRLVILRLALLGVTMYPILMAGVSCTQFSRFYLSSRVCRVPIPSRFLSSDSPWPALHINPFAVVFVDLAEPSPSSPTVISQVFRRRCSSSHLSIPGATFPIGFGSLPRRLVTALALVLILVFLCIGSDLVISTLHLRLRLSSCLRRALRRQMSTAASLRLRLRHLFLSPYYYIVIVLDCVLELCSWIVFLGLGCCLELRRSSLLRRGVLSRI
jgi:hypothetical protein